MAIKECGVCYENIHCFDDVVVVDDKVYHEGCVQLSPHVVGVFANGKYLGTSEEFDNCAYDVLSEGEYEEEEE